MIQLFPFKIPFKDTFKTSVGNFNVRNGVLVCFNHLNHKYYSEVSPLPEFSLSNLDTCIQILIANTPKIDEILTGILNDDIDKIEFQSIQEIVRQSATISNESIGDELRSIIPPEIHFALDHFIFQILVDRISKNRDAFFDINVPINVSAKSLNDGLLADNSGIKTLKIKVGMDTDSEVLLIKSIRNKLPDIKIRLDANGAWDLNETISFIEQVKPYNIEYIEQPLSNQELFINGHKLRDLGVPIAADESARTYSDIVKLINNESVEIMIIKPPMIGSFENLLQIYELAKNSTIPCVFTSNLDSAINRRFAAILCSAFGSKKHDHGFGTGNFFENDITNLNDRFKNGNLILSSLRISEADINFKIIGNQIL